MPSRDEYPADEVQACFSSLLELFTYLRPYREFIVLIGGWVPFLLTQGKIQEPHIGSLDIDLALDANRIPEDGYDRILAILEQRLYQPARNPAGHMIPARYEKLIQLADGRQYWVRVDFLAPEYGGSGRKHRHQRVQDLLAHKARGSDLVFTHFVELDISGHLPNRAEHRERIKIANPASCFVMKAITFGSRRAEKDAYDLYILCDALGVQVMIEALRPIKNNGLTQEALSALRETFDSPNALGPYSISDFFKALDGDAERLRRRAFELIQSILDSLEPDSR